MKDTVTGQPIDMKEGSIEFTRALHQ